MTSFLSIVGLLLLLPYLVNGVIGTVQGNKPVTAAQLPIDLLDEPRVISGRQKLSGDGYGGEGYTVLPVLQDEPPATVIIVHGLGGTGEEWGFVALALSFFSLNFVKFIIPTAPSRYVSYLDENIPSWYNIYFIRDYQTSVNNSQLLSSVARLNYIVQSEIDMGVASNRIFFVGFSQGGGLALTAFLRSPVELGGCVGVATWLPKDDLYPAYLSPTVANRRILMMHGTNDDAVPISLALKTKNRITDFGSQLNLTVNFTRLIDQGHLLITPVVMTAIEDYVSERASGTTKFLLQLVDDLTQTFSDLNNRMRSSFPRLISNCLTFRW